MNADVQKFAIFTVLCFSVDELHVTYAGLADLQVSVLASALEFI